MKTIAARVGREALAARKVGKALPAEVARMQRRVRRAGVQMEMFRQVGQAGQVGPKVALAEPLKQAA